jgi:hypothetical protein
VLLVYLAVALNGLNVYVLSMKNRIALAHEGGPVLCHARDTRPRVPPSVIEMRMIRNSPR